jgi:hypothetical protein
MRRRAIAAASLALAVAACGSSSPSSSRLRQEATSVCQRSLAQSDAIASPAVPSGTAAFLRRGTDALAPELAGLRALKPPSHEAGSYSTALIAASRELSILDGAIRDLDHGADPLGLIKTLQRRLAPVESAENVAWRTLDIPGCASR